ncbi:MAG: Rpn family recombination-promoting nuclease/putative transposase [Paludibacteraceae bacterium]|nr:Rpn family recombination-promoting nuclease/putative transposase [Paludibacteraceae bacterium]
MAKFISPLTDVGFKRIFGDKQIMLNFLNALFEGEFVIKDLEYLDKEQEALPGDERNIFYDLFCKTDTGTEFIVEMQCQSQTFFKDRILYYMSRAIAGQGMKGDEWNYKLMPVYGVYFMNFSITDDGNIIEDVSLYSKSQLKEGTNAKPFTEKLRAVTIDMHAFNKQESNCEKQIDQWIYNIKNMEGMTSMPFKDKNNIFAYLETLSDYYAMNPEDRKLYDAALRRSRDYYATLETAKVRGIAEGRAEGIAEGRAEGIAKGRAEGIVEGRAEGRTEGIAEGKYEANIINARKMKAKGYAMEDISEITGLSLEEIAKL